MCIGHKPMWKDQHVSDRDQTSETRPSGRPDQTHWAHTRRFQVHGQKSRHQFRQ